MALNTLTLSVNSGVQGRKFEAAISGQGAGSQLQVDRGFSPGFWVANGRLYSDGLPYAVSSVGIRERNPNTGETLLTVIDITAATRAQLEAKALSAVSGYVFYRVVGTYQPDRTYAYTLVIKDAVGATTITPVVSMQTHITGFQGLNASTTADFSLTRPFVNLATSGDWRHGPTGQGVGYEKSPLYLDRTGGLKLMRTGERYQFYMGQIPPPVAGNMVYLRVRWKGSVPDISQTFGGLTRVTPAGNAPVDGSGFRYLDFSVDFTGNDPTNYTIRGFQVENIAPDGTGCMMQLDIRETASAGSGAFLSLGTIDATWAIRNAWACDYRQMDLSNVNFDGGLVVPYDWADRSLATFHQPTVDARVEASATFAATGGGTGALVISGKPYHPYADMGVATDKAGKALALLAADPLKHVLPMSAGALGNRISLEIAASAATASVTVSGGFTGKSTGIIAIKVTPTSDRSIAAIMALLNAAKADTNDTATLQCCLIAVSSTGSTSATLPVIAPTLMTGGMSTPFPDGYALELRAAMTAALPYADFHFQPNAGATDDYIRNALLYLKANFPANRKIRVEPMNETWNFANAFAQGWNTVNFWGASYNPAAGNLSQMGNYNHAGYSVAYNRIMAIAMDVFSDQPDRLVRILTGQISDSPTSGSDFFDPASPSYVHGRFDEVDHTEYWGAPTNPVHRGDFASVPVGTQFRLSDVAYTKDGSGTMTLWRASGDFITTSALVADHPLLVNPLVDATAHQREIDYTMSYTIPFAAYVATKANDKGKPGLMGVYEGAASFNYPLPLAGMSTGDVAQYNSLVHAAYTCDAMYDVIMYGISEHARLFPGSTLRHFGEIGKYQPLAPGNSPWAMAESAWAPLSVSPHLRAATDYDAGARVPYWPTSAKPSLPTSVQELDVITATGTPYLAVTALHKVYLNNVLVATGTASSLSYTVPKGSATKALRYEVTIASATGVTRTFSVSRTVNVFKGIVQFGPSDTSFTIPANFDPTQPYGFYAIGAGGDGASYDPASGYGFPNPYTGGGGGEYRFETRSSALALTAGMQLTIQVGSGGSQLPSLVKRGSTTLVQANAGRNGVRGATSLGGTGGIGEGGNAGGNSVVPGSGGSSGGGGAAGPNGPGAASPASVSPRSTGGGGANAGTSPGTAGNVPGQSSGNYFLSEGGANRFGVGSGLQADPGTSAQAQAGTAGGGGAAGVDNAGFNNGADGSTDVIAAWQKNGTPDVGPGGGGGGAGANDNAADITAGNGGGWGAGGGGGRKGAGTGGHGTQGGVVFLYNVTG